MWHPCKITKEVEVMKLKTGNIEKQIENTGTQWYIIITMISSSQFNHHQIDIIIISRERDSGRPSPPPRKCQPERWPPLPLFWKTHSCQDQFNPSRCFVQCSVQCTVQCISTYYKKYAVSTQRREVLWECKTAIRLSFLCTTYTIHMQLWNWLTPNHYMQCI